MIDGLALRFPGFDEYENSDRAERIALRLRQWGYMSQTEQSSAGMQAAENYMKVNGYWQWGCGDNGTWNNRPVDIMVRSKNAKQLSSHIVMPVEVRSTGCESMTIGRAGELDVPIVLHYAYAEDSVRFKVASTIMRKRLTQLNKRPSRATTYFLLDDIWAVWVQIMLEKSVTTLAY